MNVPRWLVIGGVLLQTWWPAMTGSETDASSRFVSVDALHSACGAPGPCEKVMDCEGKIVKVKGYIDYDNVFSKAQYPHLPYEKFVIRDRNGPSIEVWVVAEDSREIFDVIRRHRSLPETLAYVEGEIVGFDMPIMGTCRRGIRLRHTQAETFFMESSP